VASGGHTALVKVLDYNELQILGSTQDDACGEAFDKVARVLDLPYPGGPMIEKLAENGRNIIPMPRPYKNQKHFNFSYSGLKTAVINVVHNAEQKNEEINKSDVAASFQSAAIDMLIENTVRACKTYRINKVAIAGGVGANGYLRNSMDKAGEVNGFKVFYPSLKLCTDNAAMIGCCAHYMIKGGAKSSDLSLDADASLKITD
jgi:N6-L-threonylcarbamoyladenine synthase